MYFKTFMSMSMSDHPQHRIQAGLLHLRIRYLRLDMLWETNYSPIQLHFQPSPFFIRLQAWQLSIIFVPTELSWTPHQVQLFPPTISPLSSKRSSRFINPVPMYIGVSWIITRTWHQLWWLWSWMPRKGDDHWWIAIAKTIQIFFILGGSLFTICLHYHAWNKPCNRKSMLQTRIQRIHHSFWCWHQIHMGR